MEYKGIYTILLTPFDNELCIDEVGLRRVIRFNLDCGVNGLVANANASEVGYLSDAERRRVAEISVEGCKGHCPVVVGVSTAHAVLSAGLARHAADIGADAVMAMPPTYHPATQDEIIGYYCRLGDATDLPIVLQNAVGLGMTPMSPDLIGRIMDEVPTVTMMKEETTWPALTMGAVLAADHPRLVGIMGGRGGKTFMEELRHGACGTMPACQYADVHMALWRAVERQDMETAGEIFRRLLPLLDFEMSYGMPLYKTMLKARGLIRHATWRQTGFRDLDRHALAELAALLDAVAPYTHPDHAPVFANVR
ncbi:dihydrodipicolinate synthase family protein [Oceaniglobus trochenteri]|uniref:dihydrodipicolinate synthase family protein n=1 Tax=Oceaniglobus trochenteri TaxID=2763260 RepID=UPI001CFFCF5D|nr:dihydrodipicolinate synthase family protein [Oceaniglobus trochenteri]